MSKLRFGPRLVLAILFMVCIGYWAPQAYAQTVDQWTTSLHDVARDGASSDTVITPSTAPTLTNLWQVSTGGPIASQPAIVNGVAYVGSWDGYEYAINDTTGQVLWKTFLGTTTGESDCDPQSAGVSSAPTVANGVVYVGGGDQYWYALNAQTGAVDWKVLTGNASGTYDGHYNWSSPLIVGNDAYVGVASLGDCPLIQGELLEVDITTGQVVNTLDLVPDGQVGGGIWTSPSYDPSTGTIYAVTGTEQDDGQDYAQAVIAIDASSLTVTSYWHLPETEAVSDSDWTTSPMLFTDENGRNLVLATNKNGVTYAFLRSNIAAGPVWQQRIAVGNDCAACGYSTVSSATIGGGLIYQAGGVTSIGGLGFGGSVQAWDPATGDVVWQHALTGPVIGAITYDNGMIIDGGGSALEVLDATDGTRLYSYDTGPGNWFYAAPAVSNGIIVTGNTAGVIYGFGLPTTTPPTPPADPNCPTGWSCQDIGSPSPAGSESETGGTWNITAGGSGYGAGSSDSFRFASQPISGNGQIVADVTNLPTDLPNAQAGVMLRQTTDPKSAFYAVYATPGGVDVSWRHTYGGNSTTVADTNSTGLPQYVELQRSGDTVTAAVSTNGVNYTLVPGATATMIMPNSALVGLATASGMNGMSGTATMTNVSTGAISNTPVDTAPATACPASWSCADIGDPAVVGNQSLSGSSWTVSGAGSSITGDNQTDQFHFVWQPVPGDITMTTHITGLSDAGDNATQAGLMLRADTTPGSAYYGAFLTPGGQIVVQDRTEAGMPVYQALATVSSSLPQYLQIVRSGTTFTTYTSTDGANWSPVVGSTDTVANLSGSLLGGLAISAGDTAAASTMTADSLILSQGTSTTPPTACPNNWACTDIGSPIPAGSQDYYNGTWSLLAGGKDIWGTYDEMHYVGEPLNTDGTVTVHVSAQGDTDPWAKSGIMMRQSVTDESSAYFGIFVTPGNGTVVQYRSSEGASTQQVSGVSAAAPEWLRVTRSGDEFTAYTSTDGQTWTAFPGGPVTISMPTSIYAGLGSTSHSQFGTSTTTFDSLSITPVNSSLPAPWTDNDIGNVTPVGSASYSNGVYTVNGGGNDIWGTPYGNLDQFHYVSQPLAGDGSIVARVTSQTNTSSWAKAGIMIKQSTAANAPYALVAVTPSNGVTFQSNFNQSQSGPATYSFPEWLKLTRAGNVITAYASPDGTTWTEVGSTNITFTNPVTMGLFVTAHNAGALSTATFDNVAVTGGGWIDTDIGDATPSGSGSLSGGIFTINGGGNDIWGTPGGDLDQFNYEYQPLTNADETITARVTSQTNTSDWAKAGVMIKQSTTAGSNYALLAVTPGNGVSFQYDYNSSVSGPSFTYPEWVRLTIAGSTVTAYSSPDGSTWTEVGSTTISITDPATIGLFVCSHNSGALSTATFDNVTLTSP